MDMSMMTMTTATSTGLSGMTMTTSYAMSSSTSSMDMDMDMGMSDSSSLMTSSEMAMVFFQAVTTPLFTSTWTPTGQSSYAGTCIFLIVLATLHRVLVAIKTVVFSERRQHDARLLPSHDEYEKQTSTAGHLESAWHGHPFRVATETCRAVVEVISGAIGYLLMLAVMTMNVGYFLSVLGGIFLGTFVAGRFGTSDH